MSRHLLRGPLAAPSRRHRRHHAQHGQVAIIFAMLLLALVGIVALSVDGGYVMAERRQAQNAADAAALAADKAVQRREFGNVVAAGAAYARENGFAGTGDTITIIYPAPTAVEDFERDECVYAHVRHEVRKFFVGAIYSGPWQVSAEAVACTKDLPEPYALVALDDDSTGLTAGGNSSLVINGGGAMSNAEVDICGIASWISTDGPLDAVETITICPNATVDANPIRSKAPAITDPLSSVPPPSAAQCGPNRADPNIRNSTPSPVNLQPGNYTNGITINGNDKIINFASGVYCFSDDLKTNGGSHGNVLTGSDVLLYFRPGAMLNVDGGGNDIIMDSGPGGACTAAACVAKMLVFYDRGNCDELRLVGGNGTDIDGILYAPCSMVHLGGGSGSEITGQVIAGAVDLLGGSRLTINYEAYVNILVPRVRLVQ